MSTLHWEHTDPLVRDSVTSPNPPWWYGASVDAKADFLVRTGRAKDFHDACSQLSRRRKQTRLPDPKTARLPYAD